ncbi:dna-directed rna polymerase subunit alpha [Gossypium australe]|uniref:Dna-directed rna polymerase subunit alpha n=1 Tax=Gossypium australe TaxID=47621 RepID=A0A5B6VVZ2_9ROSI|nr:dna-directed rna polymerase subunit alpha [Gossypium australe]
MAYIPPHKRHSKDAESPTPTPTPESLIPKFKRNVQLRASNTKADRSGRIIYSNYAISRWFAVGLDDGNGDTSSIHLKPVSVESIERKTGEKPAILMKSNLNKENNEVKGSPWSSIAENILPDLLSSFEKVRAETECKDLKDVKPGMVARFGKILFQGSPSMNLGSVSKSCITETILSKLKRTFYTSLPASYMGNIMAEVVSKIGVDFAEVKDVFQVKVYLPTKLYFLDHDSRLIDYLSDSTQPDSTISCKCRVKDDKKLRLYKAKLNPVRDMFIDISCLDMDLDLRLALSHKRILTSMTEDEMQSIKNLIDSAVLDPDVKGGLRWSFGKATSGDRYSVVGVWHTTSTAYQNSSIRLKVRYADRFDFKTTYGEDSKEVILKLKGIVSGLLEQDVATHAISDMLKDNLSLIWRHFLRCEPFRT